MKQARTFSPEELSCVLQVIEKQPHSARNRIAVLMSFYAGLRVKEIACLSISDVYEMDGNVKQYLMLKPEQTKGSSARSVVLSSKLRSVLSEYYTESKLFQKSQSFPLVPSQKRNKHFSPNSLCQVLGKLYKAAGFSGATSHSGRRTFITRLAHSGISSRVIMALAGHRHLSTTQRYIDVNDEMLKQAVEVIR